MSATTAQLAGLPLTVLIPACGIFSPEPTLTVSGTVRETAGRGIGGARVALHFRLPDRDEVIGRATTDATGAFTITVGPPSGYSYPNCAPMQLSASATGFWPRDWVPVSSGTCRDVSEVGGIVITLESHEPLEITTASLPRPPPA